MREIDLDSDVRLTVTFRGHAVPAEVILDAVRATCEANGEKYFEEEALDDVMVYRAGQLSDEQRGTLLVTPSRSESIFRSDQKYEQVVVMRHEQPATQAQRQTFSRFPDQVASVRTFAADLQQRVLRGAGISTDLALETPARGASADERPRRPPTRAAAQQRDRTV
ncbi:hypothetical protein AB0E69_36650 [Kribbella sp. NPDC026611]|uniref:hypothetical protein n=1 Tax=Kribbella sp. NPDC026611 TaxID=3154911 RepID=UPI0033D63CD9